MNAWQEQQDAGMRCRPLDSWAEMFAFVSSPPAWRSLTRPLAPRSNRKIRNCDVNLNFEDLHLENPQPFCHLEEDLTPPLRYSAEVLPRTLLCHDMANGYHDDCFVDGTSKWDAYTFYNWAGIDTFCYFSHHLVTIPPLGWINAAHAHGVKVLGTLITEWGEGVEFWAQALATNDDMLSLVGALTAIASTLNFDGWLLNVENKVSEPKKLVEFVRALHAALHAELKHAELIWYDSVTVDGDLHWQNKLNDKNKAFFSACDGLFVNYSWTPADVIASALAAGNRKHAVYIGIDVWGRNFYGGGMFNTQEALKVAHSSELSVAIFAPGWTHEALELEDDDPLDLYQQWSLRDRALWGSLWPLLNTALPNALPFKTSFCRGQGKKRRHLGEVLSPSGWFNIRHMQYQPNANHGPHGYVLSTQGRLVAASREFARGLLRLRSSLAGLATPPPSAQPSATDVNNVANTDADTRIVNDMDTNPIVNDVGGHTAIRINSLADVKDTPENQADFTSTTSKEPDKSMIEESAPTKESLKTTEENELPSETEEVKQNEVQNKRQSRIEATSGTDVEDVETAVTRLKRDSMHAHAARRDRARDRAHDDSISRDTPLPVPDRSDVAPRSSAVERSGGLMTRMRGAVRAVLRPLMACSTSESQHAHRLQGYNSHTHALTPTHGQSHPSPRPPSRPTSRHASQDIRPMTSSGRSMLQIPIKLKLGTDRTKLTLALVEDERECLEVYMEDSFNGGSCLRINPSDVFSERHRLSRLLVCELAAHTHAVSVVVVTKKQPVFESQYLNVLLQLDGYRQYKLIGRPAPPGPTPADCVYPLPVESGRFRALQRHLLLHQPEFYVPIENDFGWTIRYYVLSLGSSPITGVNVRTGMLRGPILLGHFGICHIPQEILRAT